MKHINFKIIISAKCEGRYISQLNCINKSIKCCLAFVTLKNNLAFSPFSGKFKGLTSVFLLCF